MRNTETNPSLGGTMYYTTLNRIQECDPSDNDWKALLSHLDKTEAAAYKVWEDWNEADMAVDSACAAACAASGSVARERAEDSVCTAACAAADDACRALNEDSDKALRDATWNAANKAAHAIQEIDFRAIFCGDA